MRLPFKVFGIGLTLSTAEKGLWYDSDKDVDHLEQGAGIVIKVRSGWTIRPYTKFKYWLMPSNDSPSKWNEFDPEYHGLIKFWCPVYPFISICFKQYGLYIGWKAFNLEKDKYAALVGADNIAPGNQALTPSITIRKTRHK